MDALKVFKADIANPAKRYDSEVDAIERQSKDRGEDTCLMSAIHKVPASARTDGE